MSFSSGFCLKKKAEDVMVIVSDHNVKLAGHFQIWANNIQ